MKNVMLFLFVFCLVSCSSSDSEEEEMMVDTYDGTLVGEWTIVNFGVIYDDESEEVLTDACGGAQRFRFASDRTFEVDNFIPSGDDCILGSTRQGTFSEVQPNSSSDPNFRLVFSDNANDPLGSPIITFDGQNSMRIQYVWANPAEDNIAYSFRSYQRD